MGGPSLRIPPYIGHYVRSIWGVNPLNEIKPFKSKKGVISKKIFLENFYENWSIYNKNNIMKKVIRLTESDLTRIVRRVVNEDNINESVIYKKTLSQLTKDPYVNKKGTVELTPNGVKLMLDGETFGILIVNE